MSKLESDCALLQHCGSPVVRQFPFSFGSLEGCSNILSFSFAFVLCRGKEGGGGFWISCVLENKSWGSWGILPEDGIS